MDASVAGQTAQFRGFSMKEIPGNHASQATSGARPVLKAGGLTRYDGVDDNLLTSLNPSAAFTMAFRGKVTSANRIMMGARANSVTHSLICTSASGLLGGVVGSQNSVIINGGPDIRGVIGTNVLTYDGSTVKLYRNGTKVYEGAQVGTPTTTVPVRLGAYNDNGTPAGYADVDFYKALAINRALTPAEIVKLTNAWSY